MQFFEEMRGYYGDISIIAHIAVNGPRYDRYVSCLESQIKRKVPHPKTPYAWIVNSPALLPSGKPSKSGLVTVAIFESDISGTIGNEVYRG